jgi:hypothetical protein
MLRELPDDPPDPRLSVRAPDSPALADPPDRADSEVERDGIGENFCHPPLLPRVLLEEDEPPKFPDRVEDPALEFPRTSPPRVIPRSEVEPLSEPDVEPDRWNPPFAVLLLLNPLFPVPRLEKKC